MEKWLILGAGAGKYTSLKHLIALESKTVLKTKTKPNKKWVGHNLKDLQANCKELSMTKSKQLKK